MENDLEKYLERKNHPLPKNYKERILAGIQKPPKKKGYINQISPTRRSRMKLYKEVRKEFLRDNPLCKVQVNQLTGCTRVADQIHHKARRGIARCQVCDGAGYIYLGAPETRKENPSCEFCGGTGKIDFLTDTRWFLPVCHACHRYIEDNKDWAIEKGFTIASAEINKLR